jgi:hypothetical protein
MIKTEQEMFSEHLSTFSKDVVSMVQREFNDKKGIDPVVFALNIKNNKLIIGLLHGLGKLFTSDSGKDTAAQLIKEISKQMKPLAIAFAYEGWSSSVPITEYNTVIDENGNLREGVLRPKDDIESKEVLVIHMETFNKDCCYIFEISRQDDIITLLEPTLQNWAPKKLEIKTKFGNLLQDNYSEFATLIKEQLKTNMN